MQESIETITTYPDFGQCPLHFREIVQICLDELCNLEKYCCQTCIQLHRGHKSNKVQQYARDLAKKLASVSPSQKQTKQLLIGSFDSLQKVTLEFQEQLEQTYRIFKQIKMKEYEVISRVLKSNENQIYDYLCELDLRKNGRAVESILIKLNQMNLSHAAAPQFYGKWVENVQAEVNKFSLIADKVRNQAFDLSSLDFKNVLNQIKNYQAQQKEKQKQREREKQKEKLSPAKQKQPMKEPMKEFEPIHIDLKQKDFVPQQIIQRILCHYPQSIVSINIDTNNMNSSELSQLFNTGLKFTRLEKLIMSNNYLDQGCFEVLLNANIPNLKILSLQNNFIDQDQFYTQQVQKIMAKWPGINLII